MNIAIVGATGTLGRPLLAELTTRDHAVRALSRRAPDYPVDLTTGAGLAAALDGAEVVINASNGVPSAKGADVLVEGTKRLLDATAAHHVAISIVGIEDVPMAYYRVKVAQEAAVRASGRPWTIVRITQFHDLLEALVGAAERRHVRLRSGARFEPIAVADAARAVAAVAEGPARHGVVEVAGPEVLTLTRLARDRRGVPLPLPLPPRLGRALRRDALIAAAPECRGTTTWDQWLATR